jgi:hypothetical protein
MTKTSSISDRPDRHGGTPLVVAAVVAAFSILGMLIVDHGPWNKPKVHTVAIANYSTTGEAARAVGAKVTQTDPESPLEPAPPGPKPAQAANPTRP